MLCYVFALMYDFFSHLLTIRCPIFRLPDVSLHEQEILFYLGIERGSVSR